MVSEGASLPLIHEHLRMPCNATRRGRCCGRFEYIGDDGYYCKSCEIFVHKKCANEASQSIQHPSHSAHPLELQSKPRNLCDLCGKEIVDLCYRCEICDFEMDLYCAKYPPPEVIDISEAHHHKLTLLKENDIVFDCGAANCGKIGYHEFHYNCGECDLAFHLDCVWKPLDESTKLDVMCGSISEPFVHPSHHHPLYYVLPKENRPCNGCNKVNNPMLRCIEDDCRYILDFKCATLPLVVKHRVDDHPLSLCYGEEANGKYWCDICEKRTNPNTWFYTCKDHRASLHTECVLGDLTRLMPRSIIERRIRSFEAVLNNSVTRPFCRECKARCIYPIILKMLGTSDTYICSWRCLHNLR